MATKTKPATPTKTFPGTAMGRELAYQQAVKQGERSITFVIPQKPSKPKSK